MGDSDSENEGILTNIQRLVIRPPGHTGKAKKGHICFDGGFETMNLGRVDFITNQEYDIFMRPDTANPRTRFWFHFTVENTQGDQRVLFNIVNLSKARSLFRDGLTPVIKSTSRPQWQRMPPQHVFYYKSPLHSDHFVLTFAFSFDLEDERYSFALAQPYSFSRYNLYVEKILKSGFAFFKVETVAKSIQGRKVEMITITDPRNLERASEGRRPLLDNREEQDDGTTDSRNKYQDHVNEGHKNEEGQDNGERDNENQNDNHLADQRSEAGGTSTERSRSPTNTTTDFMSSQIPIVFLMGRVHASETPTSFILQGLIDFLVSQHEIAQELRANVIFKIVPIMNPDGVYMGNTRGNLLGQDLNRHWPNPCPHAHPSLVAVRNIIHSLDQDPDVKLDIILDLHSHSSLLGLFVYGNSYDDVYRFERHIVFPKILSQNCPDFSHDNTIYNVNPAKEGTARRYFGTHLSPEVNTYTLEVSIFGYEEDETQAIIPYTDDLYCRVGRNIARAFWDFYKILGYIPIELDDDEMMLNSGDRPKTSNAAGISGASNGGGGGPGNVRSFNLLRLREIANQRNMTARTFEDHKDNNDFSDDDDEDACVGANKTTSRNPTSRRRELRRGLLEKRQSSSSIQSVGLGDPVEARIRLESGCIDSHGEDGDVSDNIEDTHEEEGTLAPRILPAPRVRFTSDLAIVPTASMAKPESPFVSPSRKYQSSSQNGQLIPTFAPELEISITAKEPHRRGGMSGLMNRGQKLSDPGSTNVDEIMVSGLGADSPASVNWVKYHEARPNVRKIGGGALISSGVPHTTRTRPLRPTLPVSAIEETSQKLSVIDFNDMNRKQTKKKKKRAKSELVVKPNKGTAKFIIK
ncbi:uncharacterized protein LOC131888832 [Tigriopus californicus]|nr:uncharacterized protein LOC131888832 [Tigriopus californicus]